MIAFVVAFSSRAVARSSCELAINCRTLRAFSSILAFRLRATAARCSFMGVRSCRTLKKGMQIAKARRREIDTPEMTYSSSVQGCGYGHKEREEQAGSAILRDEQKSYYDQFYDRRPLLLWSFFMNR